MSRTPKKKEMIATVRCAVYTRKSTEEGLEQEFNTLDAQRESGEAYITSQKNEGWHCLPEHYDDGGFSGGNMDRPALDRLLADIKAGKVDCVVVYKVDRLSRSLLDFAKIMEVFDQQHVAFVSVTQQFNTSTPMGRLVLNVLLSFAQFEREIIGERIRDKIAAQRRKGKWAGGVPVLGYDVDRSNCSPKLVVNTEEAVRVRQVFDLYLQWESLLPVVNELVDRDWCNIAWSRSDPGRQHESTEHLTGKDGRFTIGRLPNRPLALKAYIGPPPDTKDHSMRFSPVVNAEPEQTDVRIVLDPNGAREEPPAVMPPAEEGKKPTEPEAKAAAPAEPPALRTVLGKVVDPNGKPVAGAHVMLYLVNYKAIPRSQERLQSIETDQEGRFRFMPVVSIRSSQEWREYNVIVTALGKATASVFEISRPGHRPDNLEISMPEAGSLRGKITGPDGRPIAGAQVSAASPLHPPVDGIRATRSNANGDFEISDLKKENVSQPLSVPGKPGAFTTTFGSLHVQHPGFAWTAVSYNEVPSTLNVILRPAAVIEGRVINGETGEPVAGVVVEARGTPLFRSPSPYAITDSQGRYRLESLNANQYVIWAEKEGWTVHGVEGFNIDVGQTKTAPDLRLIRGQLIVGQVIDVDTGRPIRPLEDDRLHSEFDRPQVCLEICPWRQTFLGAHQFTAVREDGSFQVRVAPGMNWIRLLMPQSWEVLGSPPGTLQRETHRVNVVDGKDANVQFRVRRKAAVPLETAVGP